MYQEKAKQIEEALVNFDMLNPTENETVSKENTNPLLIAKITNTFEAEFLYSLCSKTPTSSIDIELCVSLDNGVKPLGFVKFTFRTIQSIHEYNKDIQLGVFMNEQFSLLSPQQEVTLP